jgi:hypothetical protein
MDRHVTRTTNAHLTAAYRQVQAELPNTFALYDRGGAMTASCAEDVQRKMDQARYPLYGSVPVGGAVESSITSDGERSTCQRRTLRGRPCSSGTYETWVILVFR